MIQTNISKIRYYSEKNEKKNWKFRSYLKYLDKDEYEIDEIVHRINKEITQQIDCTNCANCCKEMSPIVKKNEIIKISKRLGLSKNKFIKEYLTYDDSDEEYLINKKPCPFLKDKRCEIYDIRPEDCRSFPHLWKNGFLSRLIGVVENYAVCPIVYNVYERLKTEFRFSG